MLALVLAWCEDLDDVRVIQASDGPGLGVEPAHFLGMGKNAGANHLDGDDAIQVRVPSLEHNSHAPLIEQLQHLETGDARQGRFSGNWLQL